VSLNEFLERKSAAWIFTFGVVLTALVGVIDYRLPAEITLFAFYLAAILLVAWYAGGRAALLLSLMSVGVWWAGNVSI
jgi:hypothetical protein